MDAMDLSRATWRKSSYSNGGGNCVQTATVSHGVAVRDTKQTNSPILAFSTDAWRRFTEDIKTSR